MPGIRLQRNGSEARDGVDDAERAVLVHGRRDRLQVADDTGRGLRVRYENGLRAAELREARGDVVWGRNLSPGVLERLELGAICRSDRLPALPEVAGGDDEDPLARRAQVRDCRLHRAGSRGAEEQHVPLGAEDIAQAHEGALIDRFEIGSAVVDDRLRDRGQHLRRHRRRSRCQQVPLLAHSALSLAQRSGA